MVIAIDNFFGCYLLYSINPKYKGRTYVGFTVNPERRIAQHNAGKHKGGAWRTSGRGPWDMTLIVHGFPSDIAALRFEWAWQNPDKSRRLKHVKSKTRKETPFQFRIRIMCNMLCQTPWKRLPLTVRWLKQEYAVELNPLPPTHIPIAYGPVTAKVKKHKTKSTELHEIEDQGKTFSQKTTIVTQDTTEFLSENDDTDSEYISLLARLNTKLVKNQKILVNTMQCSPICLSCGICCTSICNEMVLICLNQSCKISYHTSCLAQYCLTKEERFSLLPIEGSCPKCNYTFVWGELIRKTQGFHQYLGNEELDV